MFFNVYKSRYFMRSFLIVVLAVLVVGGLGCTQSLPKPPGFPPLVPCRILVIQDDSPLPDADVILIPVNPTGTVWAVGGQTNAAGIAEMRTHGVHVGAPIDQYKVVVSKIDIVIGEAPPVVEGLYRPPPQTFYDLVNPALGSPMTTTLQIEVVRGTTDYSIDVGAAVRAVRRQP